MSQVEISRVVEVFESNKAKWVLVGAHAVNVLTEPRTTADHDFIVDARKLKAIVRNLTAAFGALDVADIGVALRLTAIDVDLIRSTGHPLYQEALRSAQIVGEWKVPRVEVLIALKFLAAISPYRSRGKKIRDISDIGELFEHLGSENIDCEAAARLGELAYPGGERELRSLLDKIKNDEPITV